MGSSASNCSHCRGEDASGVPNLFGAVSTNESASDNHVRSRVLLALHSDALQPMYSQRVNKANRKDQCPICN